MPVRTAPTADVPLARLCAIAFETLIEDLHRRLAERGIHDVRPAFGFVLLEARRQSLVVTDVARLMGVSKQAASKLVSAMQRAGYLRSVASDDARAKRLELTARGRRLLEVVETIYRELESEWAEAIGRRRLEALRHDLAKALRAHHGGELPAVRPPPR